MAANKRSDRRKNYFIKKRFQTDFILKFCLLVMVAAVISSAVIYRFSAQSTTTVFEDSRLSIKPGSEFILPGLLLGSLVSVIVVGVAAVAVTLFVSHRIAGPLYKFEESIERLGKGDLSFDIHFRRKDEIKKMSEIFNSAVRNMNRLMSDIKTEMDSLDKVIKELKASSEKMPADEKRDLEEVLGKLESSSDTLKRKLAVFKLK